MVRTGYLAWGEKSDTIPLWQEAFPEDGPGFLDYYYKEKTRDNRILAAWEEGPEPIQNSAKTQPPGQAQNRVSTQEQNRAGTQAAGPAQQQTGSRRIISMIHRNPYRLWAAGHVVDSDYIVAVATAKDRRHQGLMRMLMNRMLKDMHRDGMPFCYLMPADRRIYEPFGFVYVYDQEHWGLTEEAEETLRTQKVGHEDAGKVSDWMERWLEERYQVFAVRDQAYVERMLAELESEAGWMEFLFQEAGSLQEREKDCSGNNPVGLRCWWGVEKREQRMLLCRDEYREVQKEKTPAIMARITDLEKCLKLVHLKKDCPVDELEIGLQVKDELCPWNDGGFLWKVRKEKSAVVRQGERQPEECLETGGQVQDYAESGRAYGKVRDTGDEDGISHNISHLYINIDALTQWIFGYIEPKEPEGIWQYIDTWNRVFLDEVV